MAYIIIFAIVGLVLGIMSGCEWWEKLIESTVGMIAGFTLGVLCWVSIGLLIGLLLPTKEEASTKEIYALNDGTNISGYSYLARGYVEEEEIIKYISDGEYGKKIYTADADNSYINEGSENAYVEIRDKQFKHYWFALFACEFYDDVYIFYVPDGSVTNEINIDLE